MALSAVSGAITPETADEARRGGGGRVLIHSGDTDAVARRLLTQTSARDLEITSRGLEEAFIALTGDGAAGPAGESQAGT